jgi:hypothetical protein
VERISAEERSLAALAALLHRCVLAELPLAVEALVEAIGNRSASADAREMIASFTPLAEVARYGDVRGTRAEAVLPILAGLWERIAVELPGACQSLDGDAARQMLIALQGLDDAIRLLDRQEMQAEWSEVLASMSTPLDSPVDALVRGWCCGTLLDTGRLDDGTLGELTGLMLSPVTPAEQAAAWVEGLLSGSGLLILHREALWLALDRWLAELPVEAFEALLPLLRRAVSHFTPAERRRVGEKVAELHRGEAGVAGGVQAPRLDRDRADLVLPVLAHILGVSRE